MDRREFIKLPMGIRREMLSLQADNYACHKAIDDFCEQHRKRDNQSTAIHWTIKQLLDLGSKLSGLPKDKPPLLTELQMAKTFYEEEYESNVKPPWYLTKVFKVVAQAQREADIEYYEGNST